MKYNFDEIIDRRPALAKKYDGMKGEFGREDLFPMWIADMDFRAPDCIIKPLVERIEHGIYGYSVAPDSYWQSIIDWEKAEHDWDVSRQEMAFANGGIRAEAYVLFHFTRPGDYVLVQPPVYKPFLTKPEANGRKVVMNPLKFAEGRYQMDFEDLENKLRDYRPRLMILCNPHNPVGHIWAREDLQRVAALCKQYGTLVMSDELHSDMPLFGNHYTPFATVSQEARDNCVVLVAPSKTFNIAGIISSTFIVPNPQLREGFFAMMEANEFSDPYFMAFISTEMAFRYGRQWRDEMLRYIEGNVDYACDYLEKYVPAIKPVRPMCSYVLWLDCSGISTDHGKVMDFFLDKAHVAMNDGIGYGPGGECHVRMNLGTPRANVEHGLELIRKAYEQLQK